MIDNKGESSSLSIQDLDDLDNDSQNNEKMIEKLRYDPKFKKILRKSILEILKPVYSKIKSNVKEITDKKIQNIPAHACKDIVEASLNEFITEFDEYYQKDNKHLLNRIKRLEESLLRVKDKNTAKGGIVKDTKLQKKRDISSKSAKIPQKKTKKDNSASFNVSRFKANSSLISKSSEKKNKSQSTFQKMRDKEKHHKQKADRIRCLETEVNTLKERINLLEEMVKGYKTKSNDADKKALNKSVFDILGSINEVPQNNKSKSIYSEIQKNRKIKDQNDKKYDIKEALLGKNRTSQCNKNDDVFLQLNIGDRIDDKENKDYNKDEINLVKAISMNPEEEMVNESHSSQYIIKRSKSNSDNNEKNLKEGHIIYKSENADE